MPRAWGAKPVQPLPVQQPVVVSLNPQTAIAPQRVVGEYDYAHPVFDLAAIQAQQNLPGIQGQQHSWFAGAWAGYGFHEDGLKAGLNAARQLLTDAGARREPPAPAQRVIELEAVAA